MHYYEFNIGDYRRRTTHLTPIEHYIYRTLLDWYFLDEKPLKADIDYLLRILGLPKRNSQQLQNVLQDFFVEVDGVYHNKRADEMLAKYKTKQETNSENGKKGGRPSKKTDENQISMQDDAKQSVSDVKPTENRHETEIKPTEKATNNHKPITNNTTHTYACDEILNDGQDFDKVMKWVNAWQPTMHEVNSVLQMSGENPIAELDFQNMKFAFVSYYQPKLEGNTMRLSQLLGKLPTWIKNDNLNALKNSGVNRNANRKPNSSKETPEQKQQRLLREVQQRTGINVGANSRVIDGDFIDVYPV